MSWILVSIEESLGGGEQLRLYEAYARFPGARSPVRFVSSPLDASIGNLASGVLRPEMVRQAGNWLYRRLGDHPAVETALRTAVTGGTRAPIYIQLLSPAAEDLPWEMLCDGGGLFFALDRRWPVARIAAPDIPPTAEYYLERPLRVMAVLSAAGVNALPEWEALYEAIRDAQLPVKLRVIVGEPALKAHIDGVADPLFREKVVEMVPGTPQQLRDRIGDFEPNVLHFFCHGTAGDDPALYVATVADHARGDATGGVRVSTDSLDSIQDIHLHTWLITLNCCRGAAAEKTQSLARSLVTSQNGFPVVVGMREAITSPDAHLFCYAFYRETFRVLKDFNDSGDQSREICWAELLQKPRMNLGEQHAAGAPVSTAAKELKQWTLPVVYVQSARFRLRRAVPDPGKRIELEMLRRLRNQLSVPRGMPTGVLEDIEERIRTLEEEI
jgi:hypothetical protein